MRELKVLGVLAELAEGFPCARLGLHDQGHEGGRVGGEQGSNPLGGE